VQTATKIETAINQTALGVQLSAKVTQTLHAIAVQAGNWVTPVGSEDSFEIAGRTYPLTSLKNLFVANEAVGREKDLLAVKELRAIAAKRAQK